VAKHLKISGRVQGVGFRYSMSEEAERLGVTGWVRNRRDGTVEAVIDGTPDAVEAVLAWKEGNFNFASFITGDLSLTIIAKGLSEDRLCQS